MIEFSGVRSSWLTMRRTSAFGVQHRWRRGWCGGSGPSENAGLRDELTADGSSNASQSPNAGASMVAGGLRIRFYSQADPRRVPRPSPVWSTVRGRQGSQLPRSGHTKRCRFTGTTARGSTGRHDAGRSQHRATYAEGRGRLARGLGGGARSFAGALAWPAADDLTLNFALAAAAAPGVVGQLARLPDRRLLRFLIAFSCSSASARRSP